MRIRIILTALIISMGAFFFPLFDVNVLAAQNVAPPSVDASITDGVLRIEAIEGYYGVEAVFINGERFNYRVDGTVIVDAQSYVGTGRAVSIYAVDFAGNKSNVVVLDNPFFAPAPEQQPAITPQPIRTDNPLTPDGQASILDQATENDGKDFYTFTTPADNTFYLIIDHQRSSNNVYFLNTVTENDLLSMAETSDKTGISTALSPTSAPTPEPETPMETPAPSEPEPPSEKESGTNSNIAIILTAVVLVGGAAYYFKIVRPKKQAANSDDDYNDEDDDGEDMGFLDENDHDDEETEEDE